MFFVSNNMVIHELVVTYLPLIFSINDGNETSFGILVLLLRVLLFNCVPPLYTVSPNRIYTLGIRSFIPPYVSLTSERLYHTLFGVFHTTGLIVRYVMCSITILRSNVFSLVFTRLIRCKLPDEEGKC